MSCSWVRFCLGPALLLASSLALAAPDPTAPGELFPADPLSTAAPSGAARLVLPGATLRPTYAEGLDWAQIIDQTWGPSRCTIPQLLYAFDTFWDTIDRDFACFQGLDVDWTALRVRYRTEIQGGVSRGRFAAIMNHLALALRESHTQATDSGVNYYPLTPGVPLFVVGGWGNNAHFGAGLTPLPDSSLLVYKAIPSHPLGLVPGDIVLGYQGIPWKRLYPELLAAELPLTGWWWGSSPSSWTHSMLMSAGLNWHLFDTIDVVKHATGDTVHLSVAPLAGFTSWLDCTEQLPVGGVPMPDYLGARDMVSWGLVTGTQVGYVYVRAWTGNAGTEFYNAIDSLLTRHQTEGLIFDFRTNYGGNMFLAYPGLESLFGEDVSTIAFAKRCHPSDHFAMCPSPSGLPSYYVIHGTAAADYDRPIAVLVGPGAISSGDQVANLFRYHPQARFFGRSTSTAFNAPAAVSLTPRQFAGRYAAFDAYRLSDPDDYLTHDEFPVDEPVWLTPAGAALGHDTVVDAALAWISAGTSVAIDIRPGDGENTVNPGAHGVLPVAILSDTSFDATTVAPLSVKLAGAGVRLRPNGSPMTFREDVNGDGRGDFVLHVETDDLDLSAADTVAQLTATVSGSRKVHGWDRVRVVGNAARPPKPGPTPLASGAVTAPALLAVRNLPGSGLRVSLTLLPGVPASLELLDVMGRRVQRLALAGGGFGPGDERLDGASLTPGVYWVRLRQGDRALTAKAVVVK